MKLLSAALLVGVAAVEPNAQASTLQPYQMVRSLQLVQDELAAGDHAALPMQRKLLELIDERLREAPAEEFADERNLRALLIYGVSGGNPRTVEIVLLRLGLTSPDSTAGGVLAYLQGRTERALTSLAAIDPLQQQTELAAFLALVKGTVLAGQDPAAGLAFLDQARLLAPGTLIEESALRRTIALAASLGDASRFLRASSQYVRRFLRSPYASQFADAFVAGAVDLAALIDIDTLAGTIAEMPGPHQEMVYLRLARKGAISGLSELSAFAAAKASELGAQDEHGDPRALLYSSIASVTSETIRQTAEKLKAIDREKLTRGDRMLLEAAEAIAAEVLSPPALVVSTAPPDPEIEAAAAAAPPEAQPEPVEVIVDEARKRLDEIDKMLGASGG